MKKSLIRKTASYYKMINVPNNMATYYKVYDSDLMGLNIVKFFCFSDGWVLSSINFEELQKTAICIKPKRG